MNCEGKFHYLLKIDGIGLAMASAILTVLFPKEFTIYDFRACEFEPLKKFAKLKDKEKTSKTLWGDYADFIRAVHEEIPQYSDLRNKDRFLWGKSFYDGLVEGIKNNFEKK